MTGFSGVPADALAFFAELEGNNERTWWLANRARFESSVRAPLAALLDELEPVAGPFHVFRMNRDVRFAKDKSPYKTAQGAVAEAEGGTRLYVQISAAGLFVGGGMYHGATDQIARMRCGIHDESTGAGFVAAVAAVRQAGLTVDGGMEPPLATAPRGFARDHPRIEYLRWKGCTASKDFGAPKWLHTTAVADRVRGVWTKAEPLFCWLDAHVGPSELPPER